MLDSRLFHFIKKEFIQLSRDRRMLFIALAAPLIQLTIFGYVASTDIKHVSTIILDEDRTAYSRTYLRAFQNSSYFDFKYYVDGAEQIAPLIDRGQAKLALRVPVNFGKKLVRGETAPVQAILDGTNSSAATTIQGYINQINFGYAKDWQTKKLERVGLAVSKLNPINLQARVWYNPELKSIDFMVPAIIAQILLIITINLTTSSIVKEKEQGTIEMLLVTPIKSYELILGKLLPFVLVTLFDVLIVFLTATLWFKVPMHGSLFLLLALAFIFLLTSLGLGLFISTNARTLQQSIMMAILVMLPSVILSGFIFPIANMPWLIQFITYFIPLRYFLVIVRDIFLKGSGVTLLWPEIWPLLIFATVILSLSVIRFRKKLE